MIFMKKWPAQNNLWAIMSHLNYSNYSMNKIKSACIVLWTPPVVPVETSHHVHIEYERFARPPSAIQSQVFSHNDETWHPTDHKRSWKCFLGCSYRSDEPSVNCSSKAKRNSGLLGYEWCKAQRRTWMWFPSDTTTYSLGSKCWTPSWEMIYWTWENTGRKRQQM